MNQIGYVKEVKGTKAYVMFKRMSECGDKCASCSGHCEAPPLILDMDNTLLAETGDTVEVIMEDNTFFKFTFFAYVVPLILMLLGISIGYILTYNELTSAFTGLAFLGVSYGILRIVNNNHKKIKKKLFLW
ncbi:SoxR reducing system RseC family protein [Clostridium tetanomorphum]|uniref:SoxR reducing system RseC family protein n=1 Tax=Clostridium tetanomorphum TaxID=1553 RepID=UPI000D8CE78F|nr:SoxR reducing system RseC family protein [Clostridium tetanomorphum]SQC03054.1 sigma-E factor regulator, RseC/MucC family [Clostridium tetanomorphum]